MFEKARRCKISLLLNSVSNFVIQMGREKGGGGRGKGKSICST
jgi:hypothetical protein